MLNLFLTRERKLRNGWWIAIFFLVLAALVVPAAIHASSRQGGVPATWQALMVLAATWVCLTLRRESPSALLGPARSWLRGIPTGIALGVAIWSVTAGVLWVTGAATWRLSTDAVSALQTGLGEGIAIAVAEEMIFRGFVFRRLIDAIGAWPAQLAMAAYFLLNHWDNPGMTGPTRVIAAANIFLAGLLFGALYLRTRSLAIPIALHFALNFTQGNLLGFGVSGHANAGLLSPTLHTAPAWWTGGAFGLEASVPGTLVILGVLVAALRWRVRKAAAESPGASRTN